VLVTGAAGFIGTHLTRSLAAAGHDVRAVDVRPMPRALFTGRVQYHQLDIRDRSAVGRAVAGVDTVYHLASAHLEVNAPPAHYREVNVDAAEHLAEDCAAAGVRRLVHTSSVGIYGDVRRPPATEEAECAPRNTYERTKLEGERAVTRAAEQGWLDLIVLRPAWVYGPGCARTAKLLRSVLRQRFVYVGHGTNLRHPLFIDDLVDAYRLAAAARAAKGTRVYNVAGPRSLTLRELVGTCASVLGVAEPRRRIPRVAGMALGRGAELVWGVAGREPPFSTRSLSFFESDNAFDTAAARRELGFVPAVDLEEGLRRTLENRTWPFAA
jgi:nucleoside-diphosphate-sugar epimerase